VYRNTTAREPYRKIRDRKKYVIIIFSWSFLTALKKFTVNSLMFRAYIVNFSKTLLGSY
jgi:hypothetical protein